MKKLSKIVVKDQAETLNKEEMKLILGGSYSTYRCCCGMGQISQEDCSNVISTSASDASYMMYQQCGSSLAGCFF